MKVVHKATSQILGTLSSLEKIAKIERYKTMKKIYFDFETTSTDTRAAHILEACFLFVENGKIIKKFHEKIFVNEDIYCFISKETKDSLKFNGINSIEDLREHNKKSSDWKYFWIDVSNYIKKFSEKKIPLTGWNNAGFDNLILKNKIEHQNYNLLFDYHTRDIMHNFRILYEKGYLKGLSLMKVHRELIRSLNEKSFHSADVDCIATKELDEWFENNYFNQLINNAIEKADSEHCAALEKNVVEQEKQ